MKMIMKTPKAPFRFAPLLCLALGLVAFSGAQAATRADFYAVFNPAAGQVPFPTNLLFSGSTDGTLNIPVDDPTNLADPKVAMNSLDGFSTVAPLTANFSGTLKAETVKAGSTVRVFEVTLTQSFAVTEVKGELQAGVDYSANLLPQDANQTTLNIHPLLPLKPKTGYLVVLTDGIQDSGGYNALPSTIYALTKLTTPLVDANGKSVIPGLSDAQAQVLEPLRQLTNNQEAAAASQGVDRSSIVLSWTFMTQSIDDAFVALGKDLKPQAIFVKPTGATTAVVPSFNLPGFSDIYAGEMVLPYYLSNKKPLEGYWQTASGGSVTRYDPLPAATSTLLIPVLMTVPNAKSGQSKPADGWPVVIFQHPIHWDRTLLFTIADALSFAGFAAVAIDAPLHGVTDKTSPFYMPGMERTFDLDLVNNETLLPPPDGIIDPTGTWFLNLKNLLNSRDNLRQTAQDLRQLVASLPWLDLNADGKPDLDLGHIRFVAHSLGGIVGGTFLGIEDKVTSATLAMTGGGIAKLLDGSAILGPRDLVPGLATAGLIKGTPEYETFLNLAQTVIDPGDSINYGATAASLHPIHMIEVVGGDGSLPDQYVPNSVPDAPLSGTEPLAKIMELKSASRTVWDDKGVRAIVRFTQGDHTSLLFPASAETMGVTAEMQGQMISFLNSEGEELEILYRPVIQQ